MTDEYFGIAVSRLPNGSSLSMASSRVDGPFFVTCNSTASVYPVVYIPDNPPETPEPKRHCAYCHGVFISDTRGNCGSCGAPYVDPDEKEDGYESKYQSVGVSFGGETYHLAALDDLDASSTQKAELAHTMMWHDVVSRSSAAKYMSDDLAAVRTHDKSGFFAFIVMFIILVLAGAGILMAIGVI